MPEREEICQDPSGQEPRRLGRTEGIPCPLIIRHITNTEEMAQRVTVHPNFFNGDGNGRFSSGNGKF